VPTDLQKRTEQPKAQRQVGPPGLGAWWGADQLWDDFGLFALRTPRQLSIAPAGYQVQLTYSTATGLLYSVLVSVDAVNWTVRTNLAGDGQSHAHNFPAGDQGFFRLMIAIHETPSPLGALLRNGGRASGRNLIRAAQAGTGD
jgi:hypothetical protein